MVAGERWEVVLVRRYFAGGTNRRCDRWDVGVRQSKARVLVLRLIACHTGMGQEQEEDLEGPRRLLHTLFFFLSLLWEK